MRESWRSNGRFHFCVSPIQARCYLLSLILAATQRAEADPSPAFQDEGTRFGNTGRGQSALAQQSVIDGAAEIQDFAVAIAPELDLSLIHISVLGRRFGGRTRGQPLQATEDQFGQPEGEIDGKPGKHGVRRCV